MDRNQWLNEIAASIADGAAVDWDELRRRGLTDADLAMIRQLRSVEQIVRAHGATPRELLPGAAWGHLTILEELGSGTHGAVYRARDSRLDRDVALKILRTSASADESTIVHEARLAAKVRHPNVVVVYGAATIDGLTGIWMELIDGKSLAEQVQCNGPLSADEVIRIGVDLCAAVAAINSAGLLHRDIKAQNVLLENNGRVVIADFSTSDDSLRTVTQNGNRIGTPAYFAPEMTEGAPHSLQTEVYALGILLHFAATGSFPDALQTASHGSHRNIAVNMDAVCVPPELAIVVEDGLAIDLGIRWTDPRTLGEALSRIQTKLARRRGILLRDLVVSSQGRVVLARHQWNANFIGVLTSLVQASVTEIRLIPIRWLGITYAAVMGLPAAILLLGNQGRPISSDVWMFAFFVVMRSAYLADLFMPIGFFCAVLFWPRSRALPAAAVALTCGVLSAGALLLRTSWLIGGWAASSAARRGEHFSAGFALEVGTSLWRQWQLSEPVLRLACAAGATAAILALVAVRIRSSGNARLRAALAAVLLYALTWVGVSLWLAAVAPEVFLPGILPPSFTIEYWAVGAVAMIVWLFWPLERSTGLSAPTEDRERLRG